MEVRSSRSLRVESWILPLRNSIVRLLSLKARRSLIGCGVFLTWVVLVLSNVIDASSVGDLMFRALLVIVTIMPVPFHRGFASG
jgi:hypothetical protein